MPDRDEEPAGICYSRPGSTFQSLLSVKGSISQLKKGLPASSADSVMKAFDMTQQELADTLHTNPKTLRSRIKDHGVLDPLQGSMIAAMAELYEKGIGLFGEKNLFLKWLHFPSASMGDIRPFDLLDTFQGIRLIMSELDAISEGTYS